MTRSKLRLAPPLPSLTSPPVDIYAAWKAEIAARDWARCHIAADRSPPIDLADLSLRRGWR